MTAVWGTAAVGRGGKCTLYPGAPTLSPTPAPLPQGWVSRRQVHARRILGACFIARSPAHPWCSVLLVGALLRLVGNAITGTVGGLQVQS